mmetsp:Transcript_156075/g.478989  ORF Transcript_156075/g.478989 Transcript_156075/m.478989 type:complete len:194 (+) Transcript_156075:88-669(+)
MLLPMPSMPAQIGPPTEYVKSRQNTMLAILAVQTAVCLMRMVLLLDILGGFIMAICIGCGWYAYKEHLHIQFICYWGMMCLINGAFDLVKLIDHWVKAPVPLFSSSLPLSYNMMSLTLVAVPLVTLPAAALAWYMYKSTTEDDTIGGSSGGYRGGRSGDAGGSGERMRLWGGGPAEQGFQAFGGSGQRLGTAR